MLRDEISLALKGAMKAKKPKSVSTLRLILAAIKDRDIAARGAGNPDGISEEEVMKVLQTMVKQRQESITFYEKGDRSDLVKQESEEIKIIQEFLPEQMSEGEVFIAVTAAVDKLDAKNLKDMGRMMAFLRENYAGCMDFGKASALLKKRLGGG